MWGSVGEMGRSPHGQVACCSFLQLAISRSHHLPMKALHFLPPLFSFKPKFGWKTGV
jgi:hypothetical protein